MNSHTDCWRILQQSQCVGQTRLHPGRLKHDTLLGSKFARAGREGRLVFGPVDWHPHPSGQWPYEVGIITDDRGRLFLDSTRSSTIGEIPR